MIDWGRSYRALIRVFRVNADTWQDAEQVGGIDSVSITRSCTSDAPLLESGSMSLTGDGGFENGYYRIVMMATQDYETERVDVATLLCESTQDVRDYGVVTPSVTCNSVLYPAYTQRMLDGSFMAPGTNGAEYAAELLRGCIKAPVVVDGAFAVSTTYWFDFGIRVIEAVWAVLDIGGFVMQIDGDGTVHIRPKPTEAALNLDETHASLLSTSVRSTLDIAKVPNRYVAKSDAVVAVAVNDDPASPTSTVRRGYVYDVVDESPAPVNDETLYGYAARKLAELSTGIADVKSYTREYWPGVRPFDIVSGSLNSVGIEGDRRVQTQSLSLAHGILVSEQSAREVTLWQS